MKPVERGEGSYRVTFHTVGLLSGKYHFNVDVTHQDNEIPGVFPIIDARDKVVSFDIVSDTHNIGIVDLGHTWDFVSSTKPRTQSDTLALR